MVGLEDWAGYYGGLESQTSPRVFNSHLPAALLPAQLSRAKTILVARNVKDCAVSYFHHNRLLKVHNFQGDFPTFASLFRAGLLPYGCYWAGLGELLQLHRQLEPDSVLLLWYEEITSDLPAAVRRLAAFLGYSLTEAQVQRIAEFMKFDRTSPAVLHIVSIGRSLIKTYCFIYPVYFRSSFRYFTVLLTVHMRVGCSYKQHCRVGREGGAGWNAGEGEFARRGRVGDWRNYFDPALAADWDTWTQQQLQASGIREASDKKHFGVL